MEFISRLQGGQPLVEFRGMAELIPHLLRRGPLCRQTINIFSQVPLAGQR